MCNSIKLFINKGSLKLSVKTLSPITTVQYQARRSNTHLSEPRKSTRCKLYKQIHISILININNTQDTACIRLRSLDYKIIRFT